MTATLTAAATATLPQLFAYSRETLLGAARTAMAISTLRKSPRWPQSRSR